MLEGKWKHVLLRKETRERSVIVSGYYIKTLKYTSERLLCEQFATKVVTPAGLLKSNPKSEILVTGKGENNEI